MSRFGFLVVLKSKDITYKHAEKRGSGERERGIGLLESEQSLEFGKQSVQIFGSEQTQINA